MNCVPLLHSFITTVVSSHLEVGKGSGGVGTGCRQVCSIWLRPREKQKYPQMCQETKGSAGKGLPDPQGQLLVGLGGVSGSEPLILQFGNSGSDLDSGPAGSPGLPLCFPGTALPGNQPCRALCPIWTPPAFTTSHLRGLACPPAASRCSITSKLCLRRDHETRKEGRSSSREVRHNSVLPSPRSQISIRALPPQGPRRRF